MKLFQWIGLVGMIGCTILISQSGEKTEEPFLNEETQISPLLGITFSIINGLLNGTKGLLIKKIGLLGIKP